MTPVVEQARDRVEGHCRCRRVRFVAEGPPMLTMACHCTGCQRMSSSAFSLNAAIPADKFSVVQGEAVPGGLQQSGGHFFCDFCKSWMFTRPPGLPFVNVRPTMFEHAERSEPFIETYASEKLPWATTPAMHSYARFPEMDEFGSLVREFARRLGDRAPIGS